MPRQQSTKEQVQDAANQASAAAYQAGERAAAEVSNVAQQARGKAQDFQEAATNAVSSAKTTAQSYVSEGQRIASEQKTNVQDAAKKAMSTAQDYADDARKKAQPYVDNVQSFDITKTAAFHVLTHLISIFLYITWRVIAFVPYAQHLVKVAEEKEKNAGVVATCASTAEKVPVVGHRTVEVATIAVKNIRTDLSEQIKQYESNCKKQK